MTSSFEWILELYDGTELFDMIIVILIDTEILATNSLKFGIY